MTENSELTLFTPRNPLTVLTDREEFDKFYEDIKRAVAEFVPDTTTQKGRDAIKALAFKVTKTKTFLDSEGKRLTDDARKTISAVDASRRHMREQLEALKDEVRAPLDKWEEDEAERIKTVEAIMVHMQNAAVITVSDTVETLQERLLGIEAEIIAEDTFQGHHAKASALKATAVDAILAAMPRLKKEAEDRAELARLRAEAEARQQAEIEQRRKEEAVRETERRAKEQAEQEAIAKARAEKERQEAERRAAEQARREEARKAEEERQAIERRHAEELRREREARERAEEAERVRLAEAKRIEDEQIARDMNKMHRRKIMGAAKAAIMSCGVEEDAAKAVVLAIVAGEVPHVSLKF